MAFFRSIWGAKTKHKKLSEELALQHAKDENDMGDVVMFKLKYLGSTVVEKISGNHNINTEAVKNIIKVAKARRKKFQRVNITISNKGIAVCDLQGNDLLRISIYRISNCSTDPTHRQVFSFISTDVNETMECHAFVASKRKMAETVTLAVARAFGAAYEAYQIMPPTKPVANIERPIIEEKLIDFDNDNDNDDNETANQKWELFDDDFDMDLIGYSDKN